MHAYAVYPGPRSTSRPPPLHANDGKSTHAGKVVGETLGETDDDGETLAVRV